MRNQIFETGALSIDQALLLERFEEIEPTKSLYKRVVLSMYRDNHSLFRSKRLHNFVGCWGGELWSCITS